MKFTSFSIAALVTGTYANDSLSLRGASKNSFIRNNERNEKESAQVRIVVHGLKSQADAQDIAIIRKTARAAYNRVYHPTGYSVQSVTAEATASVVGSMQPDCTWCPPDDDSSYDVSSSVGQLVLASVEFGAFLKQPDCTWCPPDDDATVGAGNMLDVGMAIFHSKLEAQLCAGLRASKSTNLANVRDCSFSFLDMPGQAVDNMPLPTMRVFEAGSKGVEEAQLVLGGMDTGSLSGKDVSFVDETVLATFNQVFGTTGMSLADAKAVSEVDIPSTRVNQPDCTWCPPDDDAAAMVDAEDNGKSKKLIAMRVKPTAGHLDQPDCTWCPPDDDSVVVSDKVLAALHKTFEKKVCHKLKKFGGETFASTSDCSFRFVDNLRDVGIEGSNLDTLAEA